MLFNSKWFLQLLIDELIKTNDKKTILNLFCVNSACAKFGKSRTKYEIFITDNTGFLIYNVSCFYDSYFEALLNLTEVMDENFMIDDRGFYTYPVINYVYPIFLNERIFSFRFKRKGEKITQYILKEYISNENDLKEYSKDDMIPWLKWKKGVVLDRDIDIKQIWKYEE